MSLDNKLVYMANQIGKFFASQGPEQSRRRHRRHIKKFWDPRMRAAIFAHLEQGGAGLDPAVREALASLGGNGRRGKTEDTDAKLTNQRTKETDARQRAHR